GHNRSALLAGLILVYRGMPGAQAVNLLRHKRQGALYNKTFAAYLQALPSLAGGMPADLAGVEISLVG
uniref:hypothetical protein n=1 Tax=Salmonella sp. SAL4450 TaxID=3159905 RepID=UPI00397E2A95